MPNSRMDIRRTSDGRHAVVTTQTETETKKEQTTSSRSDAQGGNRRELNRWDSLAVVVAAIRSSWTEEACYRAFMADDRDFTTIALSAIRGAADDEIRHPNGLRYVDPRGVVSTSVPPSLSDRRRAPQCPHGAESGLCALCRTGATG